MFEFAFILGVKRKKKFQALSKKKIFFFFSKIILNFSKNYFNPFNVKIALEFYIFKHGYP